MVGVVLAAGLVAFLVGASFWRLDYEQPPAKSLPLIHADRRRRAWIHAWMLVAMFITPPGVVGLSFLLDEQGAALVAVMAAFVYALGAVCMVVHLVFRLTVTPWAAERAVADGAPPDGYAPLAEWSGRLYVVHMCASYAAFVILGAAVLASDPLPAWTGWVGLVFGGGCLLGFVATRFAGPFNPPFMAHLYTGLLGVVVLLT